MPNNQDTETRYTLIVEVTLSEYFIRESVSADDIEYGGLAEGAVQIVSQVLTNDHRIGAVDVRPDE